MPGVVLSGTVVQRGVELPLMEAQAHGRMEQRLIFNREPGVDSLLEAVPLLTDGADAAEVRLIAELCRALSEHNVEQLRIEHTVTGWASTLAIDLHSSGLAGDGVRDLGVRAVASRVRGPLAVLLDDRADLLELADAVREIDAALGSVPRVQIFGPSLENLLGGRKFRLLQVLDSRRRAQAVS